MKTLPCDYNFMYLNPLWHQVNAGLEVGLWQLHKGLQKNLCKHIDLNALWLELVIAEQRKVGIQIVGAL